VPDPSQSFGRKLARRLRNALLALDARIDTGLYAALRAPLALFQKAASLSEAMRVSGLGRVAIDVAAEGVNLAIVGLIACIALSIPAQRLTADKDWLKREDLAVTFLDRHGVEVGRRGIKHDDAIPFDDLPDQFIKAVLATEDRRFFSHFGIDVIGTLRALTVNAKAAGVVQGGSSITQQLAKNLFLTNERTVQRKINEAFLALWLEHHLTKREILGLYLDRAYMGGGAFGVQAAAQYYFGKSARDINLAESAMLAGLFKAPTKFSPDVNLPAARARANDVLSNLVDAGFMTEGQVYAARRNPATPIDRAGIASPDWYLDFAYNEIRNLAAQGKLGDERVLVVRTGLDTALQQKAERVIEDKLRVDAPAYHASQAAATIADPNGLVRAMVGGRDYGASQFNRATDALRQPGSSFKVFVYLTALLTGKFTKDSPIDASPICIGDYCVHNYDGEAGGVMPLTAALAASFNTAAIRLSVKIGEVYWPAKQSYHLAHIAALGRQKIVATARALGVTTPLPDTVSLPIGADEIKMIDMLGANATLANGGKKATPYAAIEVANSRGEIIYRHDDGPPPPQVVPAAAVAEMNNLMTHVVTEGTGRAAQLPGIAISGKTGTTNNSTNAWFNGFSGNFVGSVWFGNDDGSSMQNLTGGLLPAQTWHDIMEFAHQGVDPKPPYGVPQPPAPAPQAAANPSPSPDVAQPTVALSVKSVKALADIAALTKNALAAPPAAKAGGPVY